jgi:hypothetical protein
VLAAEGIHVLPIGRRRLRAVTHYHITVADIDYTLKIFDNVTG